MSVASDLITIIRPVNSAMVGFAVVVGVAVASPTSIPTVPTLLGFLTGFLISSYSMVVNDRYDVEVDRVNSPNRPIASGRISTRAATIYAATLLTLGITSSLLISYENLLIASLFASIAWLYSYWGKRRGLLGNFMVAASVAIPYIYGGVSVERAWSHLPWFLALTSFLASTGREVVKTISDVEGDEVRGVRSIARVYGPRTAAELSAALFLSAVLSTALPLITGEVGLVFAALILLPDGLFTYTSFRILRDCSKQSALAVKKLTLIGMLIGLIAFIAGGVYRA